jgi:DNA polymerase V
MSIQATYSTPEIPRRLALPFVEAPALQAGFPSPAADYVETALDLHEYLIANPVATFYAKVRGDSMLDALIHDGDILVVDRSITARMNRIVVATSSVDPDRLYVKMFGKSGGRPALLSRNDRKAAQYPPIFLDGTDYDIWGVVTAVIRKL